MPLDQGQIESIELSQATLQVARHFRPFGATGDPLEGHSLGRWGTAGGTIHCSNDPIVAWAECCRYFPDVIGVSLPSTAQGLPPAELAKMWDQALEAPKRTVYAIEVAFSRLADLTDPVNQMRLIAAGFALRDFRSNAPNDYGLCPNLAHMGELLGWDGIIAPSAAWVWGGRTIAILTGGQPAITAHQTGFPTIATALATRYRDGEQPAWID